MVTEGGQLWEVVSGAETGGIVVTEGKLLSSREAKARLAVGARIRERERFGDRLRFVRVVGSGPVTGWASMKDGGEELLRKCGDEEQPTAAQVDSVPAVHELTEEQESLLLSNLHSVWHRPGQEEQQPALEPVDTALAALGLEEVLLRDLTCRGVVGLVTRIFRHSFDMLELGPTQLPHLHEVILQMASFVLGKLRPLHALRGLPDSVAGFVAIQRAIRHHASARGEVRSLAAKVAYMLCFSCGNDPNGSGRAAISQRIWARMLRGTVPLVATWQSYLDHLALPPLERRERSGPRTIAFAGALLDTILEGAKRPPEDAKTQGPDACRRVVWVVGARKEIEGRLARARYFDEAGCFLSREEALSVYLVGDDLQEEDLAAPGASVTVSACSWDDAVSGRLPNPEMVVFFNTGLGTLQAEACGAWLRKLAACLLLPCCPPPSILLTCRCEAEAQGELALIKTLGAKVIMPAAKPRHIRNLYSGMAADPDIEYDDNAWFIAINGSTCDKEKTEGLTRKPASICLEDASKHLGGASGDSDVAGGPPPASRGKAVFWGILDLKYDAAAPLGARVRVLETGDGRFSRFSGCGAAIKEAVEKDVQLEKALIHRAVMVENKKLTHDLMVDSGYAHTIPRQRAYPREYRDDLASSICRDLELGADDFCVLKLCNRQRGAGVVPLAVADLEVALQELLQPPGDVDLWLREEQACGGAERLEWGSFAEQLRHWWSNECPCFVVEELCRSQLLEVPRDGEVLRFDGTLRVGFSLHQTQPEAGQGGAAQQPADSGELYQPLFGSRGLRVHWLGGYWKLPIADSSSDDLRARVISAAKQGTAPVDPNQLHDIYASLGDLVRALFEDHDLSHGGLQKRYFAFPELSAFVAARLAASLKASDRSGRLARLDYARSMITEVTGHPRNCALSYIERMCGVVEAMQGNWRAARFFFQKSLEAMPTNATTLQLLGIYHRDVRNDDSAAKMMERALLLDPDFKAPYVNLGAVCLRLRDHHRAASISKAGLVRHPGTPQLQYNLGMATLGLACKKEQCSGHIASELRSKALALLVEARDGSHADYPWTEQDRYIVVMLQRRQQCLDTARGMPKDGWYFAGWRP